MKKVGTERPPSISPKILIVCMIIALSVIAYTFMQPSQNQVINKNKLQEITENIDIPDRETAENENSTPSNLTMYNQTVETFKKNTRSINQVNDADSKNVSSPQETVARKKSYVGDEDKNDQIYTYTPPDGNVPEQESPSKANQNHESYFRNSPVVTGLQSSSSEQLGVDDDGIQETVYSEQGTEKEYIENNVAVSRSLVSGSFDAGEFEMSLTINIVGSAPNGLIIREYIPEGWNVTGIEPDEGCDNLAGEIKCLFYGAQVKNRQFTYTVNKQEKISSKLYFHGNYFFNSGDEKITKQIGGVNGA